MRETTLLDRAAKALEKLGWVAATARGDERFDLESRDRLRVIELKVAVQSARDLHAAVLQLATAVARHPQLQQGVLLTQAPRMTADRLTREWDELSGVFRPAVWSRVGLVVMAADRWVVFPEQDTDLLGLRDLLKEVFSAPREDPPAIGRGLSGWTPPRREVWKILLEAWLRREPPLQMQEMAARAGCSLPTVAETLGLLEELGEIRRTRNRAATFGEFPRRSLEELLAMSRLTRESVQYVDASSAPADPRDLLKRLERLAPRDVALGGVVAAREYVDRFDLNGLPRLDVTVLASDPLLWVEKLDPALQRQKPGQGTVPPTLVAHVLNRPTLRGVRRPGSPLLLADPAETLLDLYDLGLRMQAEEFIEQLRAKGPHV